MDQIVEIVAQWGITGLLAAAIIFLLWFIISSIVNGNLVIKSVHDKMVDHIARERDDWKEMSDRKDSVIEKERETSNLKDKQYGNLYQQLDTITRLIESIQETGRK